MDTKKNITLNYQCTQCNLKCSTKGNLKRHTLTHEKYNKSKQMSRGEKAIFKHLVDLGYEINKTFFREATFNDLRGIGGCVLRFDFKIMITNDKFILIEFDGEQHEAPIRFSSITTNQEALENYKLTRTHDRIKNAYCIDNGFEILRIKHHQINLFKVMIDEFIKINI